MPPTEEQTDRLQMGRSDKALIQLLANVCSFFNGTLGLVFFFSSPEEFFCLSFAPDDKMMPATGGTGTVAKAEQRASHHSPVRSRRGAETPPSALARGSRPLSDCGQGCQTRVLRQSIIQPWALQAAGIGNQVTV